MKKYVLLLSVGPVQSFIASARTSRDLWSGSWLLSEIAKAVAKMLSDQQATLVFPCVTDTKALNSGSDLSVGNKIQVVIQAENIEAVKTIAKQAQIAAQSRFEEEACRAKALIKSDQTLRQDIWDAQIKGYIEVQAAWALIIGDADSDYKNASGRAATALAARKATRDFFPSAAKNAFDSRFMIPKSSLDGSYETVLPNNKKSLNKIRAQLRLSETEQLDTIGIVKRLGGKTDQFTPFTRVAAQAWIERLSRDELAAINSSYEKLVACGRATRVSGNKDADGKSIYHALPFDGQLLLPARLDAELAQIKRLLDVEGDADLNTAYETLKALRDDTLAPIWQRIGQPSSYGVLILADGDKMGVLLDNAKSLGHHQAITQALSEFAGDVAETMRKFSGHTIYAGGDDVLGFVPLYQAVACAQALRKLFHNSLQKTADKLDSATPTLSIGLAIAHIMTPMGQIRDLAKRAEAIAKGDLLPETQSRNALGITLSVRSGSISDLRLRWDDKQAFEHFNNWVQAYGIDNDHRQLPSRIAYDVREIFLRTDFPTLGNSAALQNQEVFASLQDIRRAEFSRMLDHAQTSDGKDIPRDLKLKLNSRLDELDNNLENLATELIIARWLAMQTQRDIGKH